MNSRGHAGFETGSDVAVWLTIAGSSIPIPFAAATAIYSPINKKLYVFGGAHGQTAATSVSFADTRIYDPATNSWSSGAPMPEARLLMAAGYWNGKIYLVGGAESSATGVTERYAPPGSVALPKFVTPRPAPRR